MLILMILTHTFAIKGNWGSFIHSCVVLTYFEYLPMYIRSQRLRNPSMTSYVGLQYLKERPWIDQLGGIGDSTDSRYVDFA